jgi:hypothetical protein
MSSELCINTFEVLLINEYVIRMSRGDGWKTSKVCGNNYQNASIVK